MYDKWTIIILIIKEVWHGDSDRVGFVRSLNDHPWLLSIPRVIHVLRYDRSYYFVLLSYPWTAAPAAAAAKSLQSCLTLCDPIDSSPPGSPVPGILQARTLEWGAIAFSAWTAGRSHQSILKEINPEYSLEGLLMKLKLQYFGYLMWIADLLEKTLVLGNMEGKRRRGDKLLWNLKGGINRI